MSNHGGLNTSNDSFRHVWFYKGNNGWWQYDERTNSKLELEYEKQETKMFEILIAGRLYNIDLENNVQMRSDNATMKRSIKRDLITGGSSSSPIKGIAGVLLTNKPISKKLKRK